MLQQVAPYEVFRFDRHEGSAATPVSYETNLEELTQEMIGHGSLSSEQMGKVREITSLQVLYLCASICLFIMSMSLLSIVNNIYVNYLIGMLRYRGLILTL